MDNHLESTRGAGVSYKIGEIFNVYLRANRDCYVRLIHTSPKGKVQILYTEDVEDSKQYRVEANRTYMLPPEGREAYQVDYPLGMELIKAVASTRPFPYEHRLIAGEVHTKGTGIDILTRGTGIGSNEPAPGPIQSAKRVYAETTCVFWTEDR